MTPLRSSGRQRRTPKDRWKEGAQNDMFRKMANCRQSGGAQAMRGAHAQDKTRERSNTGRSPQRKPPSPGSASQFGAKIRKAGASGCSWTHLCGASDASCGSPKRGVRIEVGGGKSTGGSYHLPPRAPCHGARPRAATSHFPTWPSFPHLVVGRDSPTAPNRCRCALCRMISHRPELAGA